MLQHFSTRRKQQVQKREERGKRSADLEHPGPAVQVYWLIRDIIINNAAHHPGAQPRRGRSAERPSPLAGADRVPIHRSAGGWREIRRIGIPLPAAEPVPAARLRGVFPADRKRMYFVSPKARIQPPEPIRRDAPNAAQKLDDRTPRPVRNASAQAQERRLKMDKFSR
ncbi:hypothetical protein FHS01_003162 [Longimicrobium terrae]|uniref:Uncharacterized protein n=1 Tax=Longimicrobium terrae TaxID=1639882 RepID=A0A841H0T0_9BACT|nr:hypothetical protein [Longimicrobium terrae]MBB6071602.1 hypothetical protein [Longimicrobium terrae]